MRILVTKYEKLIGRLDVAKRLCGLQRLITSAKSKKDKGSEFIITF